MAAPTRIDDDLFAAAKSTGAVQSRSAAQQVNHWARIGRQLEASGVLRARDIERVLEGKKSYDSLNAYEQSVVRAEWETRLGELDGGVDLSSELGDSWVEAGPDGAPVERVKPRARQRRRAS